MKTQLSKPARSKARYTEEYKQEALELWRNSGRSIVLALICAVSLNAASIEKQLAPLIGACTIRGAADAADKDSAPRDHLARRTAMIFLLGTVTRPKLNFSGRFLC